MSTTQALSGSLLDELSSAQRDAWSGQLTVDVDGREAGSVVFRAGRIAWAVCSEEPEDLGTFLWRLGRVTREELEMVRRRYAAHQGSKKLGALMEEAGILPRPVLQRCLLLHTRRAVSRLLSYNNALLSAERTALRVEEDLTFSLADVLPQSLESGEVSTDRASQPASRWAAWIEENLALREFSGIGGYLASALLSRDAEVVAAHTTGILDPSTFGVFVVSMLERADRTTGPASLGTVSALCLECVHGTLVAQWLDGSRRHVALVLIDSDANPGMARYRLSTAAQTLAGWLETRRRSAEPVEGSRRFRDAARRAG